MKLKVLRVVAPAALAIGACASSPLNAQILQTRPATPTPQPAVVAPAVPANPNDAVVPSGTVFRIAMDGPMNVRKLHAGDALDGKLVRAVYVYDREVVPEGSKVHVVVASVDKEKVTAPKQGFMDHLDAVRSFGLNRKYMYKVGLRDATLTLPDGNSMPIDMDFLQGGQVVELHAKGDEIRIGDTTRSMLAKSAPGVSRVENFKKTKGRVKEYLHPLMTVELQHSVDVAVAPNSQPVAPASASGEVPLAAGTHARLLLLNALSASQAKPGDTFQARLEEPIVNDGKLVLPEGTMFEGQVRKVVKPRRLSRPASFYLTFDKITLPDGSSQKIAASLASTDVAKDAAVKMDTEGGLHGGNRGVKKTAEMFVVGVATQQIADEAVELAVHALAPYAGAATGLFFFLGGKGHDVSLPQYSELQVVFNHAVNVPAAPATTSQLAPAMK